MRSRNNFTFNRYIFLIVTTATENLSLAVKKEVICSAIKILFNSFNVFAKLWVFKPVISMDRFNNSI